MNEEQPEARPTTAPRTPEISDVPASQPEVSAVPARRPPWWLVVVLLVVAVGGGFGAGALIWAGQVEHVYPPGYQALTPEQYDKCARSVIVYFGGSDPDPTMRTAAAQLRDDKRFESVREETRQEAYDRFKVIFADQPELVEKARPEALPASVQLVVRKGSTGKQVEGALRAEFPDAEVTVQDGCPPPP
jgi:hypothetical protein